MEAEAAERAASADARLARYAELKTDPKVREEIARIKKLALFLGMLAASVLERIAKNISGVALAAGQTANGAGQGQKAASNLSSMAGSQQAMLVQFQLT